jgi:hypothetical protein
MIDYKPAKDKRSKNDLGQPKSVIREIINKIYISKELSDAKELAIQFITSAKLDIVSYNKMLHNIQQSKSLIDLQRYMTNSFLFYEKMGVN